LPESTQCDAFLVVENRATLLILDFSIRVTGATTMSIELTAKISTAAERMRRYRQRRRDGVRFLGLELLETEIDALIARKLLKEEERDDRYALLMALYTLLGEALRA
jgi:hypothetical protein